MKWKQDIRQSPSKHVQLCAKYCKPKQYEVISLAQFSEGQVFVMPDDLETAETLVHVCGGNTFLASIFVAHNGEVAGDVTVQGVQSVIDSVSHDHHKSDL